MLLDWSMKLRLKELCLAIIALAAALCLCGCETLFFSLPAGVPPPGVIVSEIKDNGTLPSPDKAVNQMATNLTFKLVSLGKPSLKLEASNDAGLGEELMKSLVASKLLLEESKGNPSSAGYILESGLDGGRWTAKIVFNDGRRLPVCGYSIELDASSLQGAK